MSILHRLFPKVIYEQDELLLSELETYKEFFLKETNFQSSVLLNVPSTHKTDDQYHLRSELHELVKTICQNSVKFLRQTGYSDDDLSDLRLQNMWVNISESGSYIFPHIHSQSFISGVFYIECDAKDELIFFNNPNDIMDRRPSRINDSMHTIQCIPGKLVLFKSNLLHGTHTQKSQRKIAVSFNLV